MRREAEEMMCGNEDSLQSLFMKTTHMYFGRAYAALREMDVHPRQVPMLHLLARQEGLSQRQISEEMKITPPTVAVSIKRMEKSGLIIRKADEKDQRMSRIYLSPKGRELSKNVQKMVKDSEKAIFHGFSESEICLMKRFFKQMIENLEQTK